jgi:hypothetical protein
MAIPGNRERLPGSVTSSGSPGCPAGHEVTGAAPKLADKLAMPGSVGLLPHAQDEALGPQLERHGREAGHHRRAWPAAGVGARRLTGVRLAMKRGSG